MKLTLLFAGFFIALSGGFFQVILGNSEDYDLSAVKLIEKNGYPAESHVIETEDGYFIQIQRIPHGKNSTSTSAKKPILVFPGILSSSNSLLLMGSHSLPFLLADKGYDVWLGNFRGTQYALLHRNLSTRSSEFWNFSFHEVGYYDLPAQIDYICNYTQRNNVILLAVSFGASVELVMASTRPEYQKKVQVSVIVGAPSIFVHRKKIFQILAPLYPLTFSKTFTNTEVFGDSAIVRRLVQILGLLVHKDTRIYENFHSLIQKPDIEKFMKVAWFFIRFYPSDSSVKVFTHYYQNALAGKFQQYDYGPDENLKRYNSREPPEYHVESITIPMGLIFTTYDEFASKENEEYFLKRMKNIKRVWELKDAAFRHLNFALGLNTTEMVYYKIIEFIEDLEKL